MTDLPWRTLTKPRWVIVPATPDCGGKWIWVEQPAGLKVSTLVDTRAGIQRGCVCHNYYGARSKS